jgi:hypothetical protein
VRHHEDAIAAFVRPQAARAETLGVVIVGSVARGDERPDSDVDVYLVITDQAYARASGGGDVAMVSRDGVDYDGGYFLAHAAEQGDVFLLQHASVHTCLAAGRLALAHHRRLFAGPKYLARDLARLDRLPGGFLAAWHTLLGDPTPAAAGQLRDIINGWLGPGPHMDRTLSRFIADNEQGWLTGTHPPEFW